MDRLPIPPPDDPLPVAQAWLDEAVRSQVQRHPNAMTLATSSASGRPSARIVLLKGLSLERGYAVFYSHYGSRKSRELAENPWAAAVLHWDQLGRQVRFEGPVVRSPEAESDEYFAARPRRSQLNAWTSVQSAPLADPQDLERRAVEQARLLGLPAADSETLAATRTPPLRRPPFWGGFRLWFEALELWVEGSDRFHDRIRYQRLLGQGDTGSFAAGPWSSQRLQP